MRIRMSVSDYPVAVIFIQLCKSIANAAPFVKELNGRGINFYPQGDVCRKALCRNIMEWNTFC